MSIEEGGTRVNYSNVGSTENESVSQDLEDESMTYFDSRDPNEDNIVPEIEDQDEKEQTNVENELIERETTESVIDQSKS